MNSKKKGTLENIEAHHQDHTEWNRRQFLSMGGMFAAGSLLLQNLPVKSMASPLLNDLINNPVNDNILVLVRLFGGNDGLNTIIPNSGQRRLDYETLRPGLKRTLGTHYTTNQVLTGFNHTTSAMSNGEFALPSVMDSVMPLWNSDRMSIIHNVGYDVPNLSHFLSTDFWSSGTNSFSNPLVTTGWMGRYLDYVMPCYEVRPPEVPPAILIGNSSDLTFINPQGSHMALNFSNVSEFNSLINSQELFPLNVVGQDCPVDAEQRYVRRVANNGFIYNDALQTAYNNASPFNGYPSGNRLARQFEVIGRLIRGRLGTRIYMVEISGFDTHSGQLGAHENLLQETTEAIKAFQDEMDSDPNGISQNVLTVAFSEFGRTVRQNGQNSTDHGNLGPVMLFGNGLRGGFHGQGMDLTQTANTPFATRVKLSDQTQWIDFRDMYATLLEEWLCVHPEIVDCMFREHFTRIDNLIDNPCIANSLDETVLFGYNAHPTKQKTIQVKYAVRQQCEIHIKIFDTNGNFIKTLDQGLKKRDAYTADWEWSDPQNPVYISPGEYILQFQMGNTIKERKIVLQ